MECMIIVKLLDLKDCIIYDTDQDNRQLAKSPDKVKDELTLLLGEYPIFKELLDFLPQQKGKILEIKEHQKEALDNLARLRFKLKQDKYLNN